MFLLTNCNIYKARANLDKKFPRDKTIPVLGFRATIRVDGTSSA